MKKRATTYDISQLLADLQSAGIPCRRVGKEIEADIDGTGHHSYKLNPGKGLYLNTASGKGGTISSLLRRHRTLRPAAGGQTREPDTKAAAQRLWMQAWICTHEGDMPPAWDRELSTAEKGVRRRIHEQERDAVIAYLRARLGPDHLLHWLRQVRIARDRDGQIMMLTPMMRDGAVCGVQRTYLTIDGQKIKRRMLGTKGVMPLAAPVGVLPVAILDLAKVVLGGEGFETVAAAVQSTGHAGLVVYDAGGLGAWAEQQAQQAEKATAEQKAKSAAAILLADRDQSMTGQSASAYAVRVLRKAGLRAHLALPPLPEAGGPKGGAKGSDWGDYPKEGIPCQALAAHLQLSIARGDSEMPPADEGEDDAPVFHFRGYRPAEQPEAPAEALPTEQVRGHLKTNLMQIVEDYCDWIGQNKDDRKPFPASLFQITTGVGKSHELKKLPVNPAIRIAGGRVVVAVGDHEQAADFEESGYFHFWGRQPDESRAPQALCQNYAEMEQAQQKGHVSQAEFCRRCSHGLAWAINNAQTELDDGACSDKRRAGLEARIADHRATLRSRGLGPDKVDPCRWQGHLRDAINAQFVVMTHASYSHSVVQDALYFADESFDLGRTITIEMQNIHGWASRNAAILDGLKVQPEPDADGIERHERAAEFFQILAQRLAHWAGQGKDGEVSIDADLLKTIESLMDATKKNVSLAAWETLSFDKSGYLDDAPLRAAFAMAQSLKHVGGGHVAKGKLIVSALAPAIERVTMGLPSVFMDATPPKALADIVQANGGQVVQMIARQDLRITRHPSRFWGLSALSEKKVGQDRVEREMTRYQSLIEAYPDSAVLMHKRAFDQLPDGTKGDRVGYWGADHRAQNSWTGRDLVIVGSFFPPENVWRSLYQQDRLAALAGGCNPQDWPAWPEDAQVEDGAWVCEGSHDVQSRLPLPTDHHIRAWLLDRITSETVQAIGRARGGNCEQEIQVRIFGGVPLQGLGAHGLTVAEYAADPVELGQSREQVNGERHEAAMVRMDTAGMRLAAKGQAITRATMAGELRATGADGLYGQGNSTNTKPIQTPFDPATYKKWLLRIQTVAPALFAYMSQTGRGASVVRAMQDAANQYGRSALKVAIEITESLISQGLDEAWRVLEDLAGIPDPLPEHQAITLVLEAALGIQSEGDQPRPNHR